MSNLISKSFANDQLKHRKSFIKQLAALKFLLRQALPVRNEHAGGSNLTVLLDSVLEESQWLKNGKYHSPEVINELTKIMAHKVLRSLLSDISSRKWYAIMADKTRDISNHEQLVLCIRSVSEDYVVHEDMIGMYRLEDITLSTIYACLKNSLVRMCLMIENCRGQAYDSAQPFQGHINGVAKKFKDSTASAISVHCIVHCVNLCLQEISRNSKPIKDASYFSMEVIQLIKYFPKRQSIFETIKSQQNSSSTAGIRTLCPTRWTVRSGAMQAIISNYEELQDAMEVSSYGSDDCSRRANGIMALMERFSTYFGLKLSILIVSITEHMSIHLQSKERSVEDGYFLVDTYLKSLKKLRLDTEFKKFFDTVKQDYVNICDPPTLPRRRQIS